MSKSITCDVLVVGGGHAGIEAAAAAARMGSKTILLTLDKNKIGLMPCNPAIGGIGKGHLIFEVSALGGVMPQLATKTYLQGNMLNLSKGPAVQGLRLQIDKIDYKNAASAFMQQYPNLEVLEATGKEILKENSQIVGLTTEEGHVITCKSLVLTTGTFLNGLVHMGLKNFSSGRKDEKAVTDLALSIKNLGLNMGRLKTGTPPRLKKSSIDISVMEEQRSDELDYLFEFHPHKVIHKHSCYITRTNLSTHETILKNAHLSPIYRGDIKGIAPRYCPSIEDKINRFRGKDSHHIFVEPESLSLDEVYPNGLSTSLPLEIQEEFIRTIIGFEKAEIVNPGYAIEYDFIFPDQLKHTLESKSIKGLFFAGQINGTTGYEEAAGQGIIAGINAASLVQSRPEFILNRDQSYIGVMIDDLVTLGVDEPYRMFTSRAERRLLLRQDNVFYRLYKKAYDYNLITTEMFNSIDEEANRVNILVQSIKEDKKSMTTFAQDISSGNPDFVKQVIKDKSLSILNSRELEHVFAEILYAPYKIREELEIKKMNDYRDLLIPATFDFFMIPGLSIELQQKLSKYKPQSIAQVNLIQGMTPAAISLLIFKVREFCENKL
jgi:tRNA uridine 5-carboxymethylaminomethyl modification enzyme